MIHLLSVDRHNFNIYNFGMLISIHFGRNTTEVELLRQWYKTLNLSMYSYPIYKRKRIKIFIYSYHTSLYHLQ